MNGICKTKSTLYVHFEASRYRSLEVWRFRGLTYHELELERPLVPHTPGTTYLNAPKVLTLNRQIVSTLQLTLYYITLYYITLHYISFHFKGSVQEPMSRRKH